MKVAKRIWTVLSETVNDWSDDRGSRLAAALAYYSLLSLAPLLLLTVAILGVFVGEDSARASIEHTVSVVVGRTGIAALETIGHSAQRNDVGTLGTLLGLGIALFGASSAFVELQAALNDIWDVPTPRERVILEYALDRFWAFAMVLAVAVLLLASLLSSAVLAALGAFFRQLLPGASVLWQALHAVSSLFVISALFAVVFKLVPERVIAWGDVFIGAFLTAVLFVAGNVILGVYLGRSGITSSYGGAGSIVGLMIWVYYSAQLVLLGAEFTHVYARHYGSLRCSAEIALDQPAGLSAENNT
jgi:membrane protein